MKKLRNKKIKTFEYDDAHIYCVMNDITSFKIIKQGTRKYGIFLKNKNKWVYE